MPLSFMPSIDDDEEKLSEFRFDENDLTTLGVYGVSPTHKGTSEKPRSEKESDELDGWRLESEVRTERDTPIEPQVVNHTDNMYDEIDTKHDDVEYFIRKKRIVRE